MYAAVNFTLHPLHIHATTIGYHTNHKKLRCHRQTNITMQCKTYNV